MRERLKDVLAAIALDRSLEARWLNTLSLLEYIGARKIAKTVAEKHPDASVLGHWADETRHALAFKELATSLNGGTDPGEYLCAEAGARYMQELDHALAAWLGPDASLRLCYLLTTSAIEQRAMQVYPLIKATSGHPEVREAVGRIVVEEQSHRRTIEEACVQSLAAKGRSFSEALAIEERCYGTFLLALEEAVRPGSARPAATAPLTLPTSAATHAARAS